ncbi:hypothetical protein H2248_002863 [Termitomyces sp. 'cryptogamus']|nr:hypothetical protein H2248_002863 [Termitomyces sp. 'cryptogamus']
MPELIAAGERRHADGNADSLRALQETAELRATVKDLAKAVNTLMARQEATPTQNGETQRPFPEAQGGRTVFTMGPTYRPSARANPPQARPTPQSHSPNPCSPKEQYHPARLIVIPHGEKFDTTQLNPHRTVNLINDRLARSENAKHLCVASAHYNYKQNLVIMLREDQKGKELRRHAEEFIDIFGVPAHTIEMVTDDRRYKVRINGVWMGRDGEGELNTPEDLLEEIERFNPVMSKVKLLSKPRWMRAEADLRGKDYSSVVLEFAKEEDAKTMLAVKYVAMYTKFCEVVHHADRPPVLQCSKCWALGHHVARCRNTIQCRICARGHSEEEHRQNETQHRTDGREEEDGDIKCVNCGGDHPATDRACPERKRYQMIAREKEGGNAEGGITLKKRKEYKKRQAEKERRGEEVAETDKEKMKKDNEKNTNTRKTTENSTRRPTHKHMSLENLLNQREREDWNEMMMEGQETTEISGNVPTL